VFYSKIMFFSGDLKQDSPSLFNKLSREFSRKECERLSQAFRLAWATNESHLSEAEGTNRSQGSSYNPAPARVAEILLAEIKSFDSRLIGSAILSFCRTKELSATDKLAYCEEVKVLNEARKLCSHPFEIGKIPEDSSYKLAMAIRLDELRHLHLTETNPESIQDIIKLTETLLDLSNLEEVERLRKKLLSALIRSKKRLTHLK